MSKTMCLAAPSTVTPPADTPAAAAAAPVASADTRIAVTAGVSADNTRTTVTAGVSADNTRLAELLRRSASGQQHAFAELYDNTSARIYGVVLRVLRSPDQAVEVTQEVYVEVWRRAAAFCPGAGSALAWMTTIAHRRAIDRVRSVSSELARDHRYAVQAADPAHDQVWLTVEQRLDADRVWRGLASLTPVQRQAIVLVYFGGYSQREVAARLGIPLGTLKTRIRDGLIRLRRHVDDHLAIRRIPSLSAP